MSKYIVENGRVRPNPAFGSPDKSTVANPQRALAFSTNVDDANTLAEVAQAELAPSTLNTVVTVQSPEYVQRFNAGGQVDGGQLLEQMSGIFTEVGAPIGLSNKLIGLQGFIINIKIDDSGSMGTLCNNRYTRWQNVQQRLTQFMQLLQVVPTGPVIFSFLDRRDVITINHQGVTPQQFYQQACQAINQAFQYPPRGGTPIYANVMQMLQSCQGRGPTAHYLFTDGQPSDSRYTAEDEIRMTKDLLLSRWNPRQNPFTFLCCSDLPTDTLWMHEIEEIACRPGAPGYVAALQNFRPEQLEVLNDMGPEFPYSEAMWMLCNLTAALNPNDLDALDQHAPLSKPTLDSILGNITTAADYESYFNQHPNANYLFAEDYQQFLTAPITSNIPAVNLFESTLANFLNQDINNRDDFSEPRAIARTEETVLGQFGRQRPPNLRSARVDFWLNHYLRMELAQAQYALSGPQARQDLWGDYLVAAQLVPTWQAFVQQCRSMRGGGGMPGNASNGMAGGAPPSYSVATGQPGQQLPMQAAQQVQYQQQQFPQQTSQQQAYPQQQQQAAYVPQYTQPAYQGPIRQAPANYYTQAASPQCCTIM